MITVFTSDLSGVWPASQEGQVKRMDNTVVSTMVSFVLSLNFIALLLHSYQSKSNHTLIDQYC